MTDKQRIILGFLRRFPDRSVTEIAVHLGASPSATDILVRRMVGSGLLRARNLSRGRRRYSIRPADDDTPIKTRKPASDTARTREFEAAHASIVEAARQHGGPFGILVAQITK